MNNMGFYPQEDLILVGEEHKKKTNYITGQRGLEQRERISKTSHVKETIPLCLGFLTQQNRNNFSTFVKLYAIP